MSTYWLSRCFQAFYRNQLLDHYRKTEHSENDTDFIFSGFLTRAQQGASPSASEELRKVGGSVLPSFTWTPPAKVDQTARISLGIGANK